MGDGAAVTWMFLFQEPPPSSSSSLSSSLQRELLTWPPRHLASPAPGTCPSAESMVSNVTVSDALLGGAGAASCFQCPVTALRTFGVYFTRFFCGSIRSVGSGSGCHGTAGASPIAPHCPVEPEPLWLWGAPASPGDTAAWRGSSRESHVAPVGGFPGQALLSRTLGSSPPPGSIRLICMSLCPSANTVAQGVSLDWQSSH